MHLRALILGLAVTAALPAMQVQDLDLVSPSNGARFQMVGAVTQGGLVPGPADMGTDVDGCRHSSGPSEYEYYVAVDPYSYFAALASEWDQRSGRFMGELKPAVLDWVGKEFGSEREIDRGRAYQVAQQIARGSGQPIPDRATFVIPQNAIPVDKRFRLALSCYERRGVRHAVLAKLALTGVWALRCRAQLPVTNQELAGGFDEVNRIVGGHIKDGETFDLPKWLGIYQKIVDDDGLTREGYTVAALALFGFQLRDGDVNAANATLRNALDRLGKDDKPDILRGLFRERRKLLEDHQRLLGLAAEHFGAALSGEEIVRQRIPEILLVTAEAHRRLGDLERAASWYVALGKLPESQPAVRAELRFQGNKRALPADRPYHVQLGWIADEALERLAKAGIANPGEILGRDRAVLQAVVSEGLGTSGYNAPGWTPVTGASQADSASVLDQVGKAVIDHAYRLSGWPKTLGELWEHEVIRDRNHVNRFHDPATGKPLLYTEPPGDLSGIAPTTVLVATSAPVDTPQGPRYGAFLANAKLVWTAAAPALGQPLPTR